jgi:hypothetical protein
VARTGPADLLERAARRRVADRDPEYCVLLRILALLVRSRVDDVLATHATTVACCLAAARLSLLPPVRLQPGNPEADLAFNRSLVSMHVVGALLAGTRMIGRASAAGSSCAAVTGVESGPHPTARARRSTAAPHACVGGPRAHRTPVPISTPISRRLAQDRPTDYPRAGVSGKRRADPMIVGLTVANARGWRPCSRRSTQSEDDSISCQVRRLGWQPAPSRRCGSATRS